MMMPRYLAQDVVNNSHDLTLQMTGRKERLSWLIGFINENAVLVKVRSTCYTLRERDITPWRHADVAGESTAASNRRRETICMQSTVVELQSTSFVSVSFGHSTVFLKTEIS